MSAASRRIPLETAHRILGTFGITRPTPAYERWVKPDGFDLDDFDAVLFESPFVLIIDWRAWLQEELELVVAALARLDVRLELDLDEDGESGHVSCGERRAKVAYRPNGEDHLDDVFGAIQTVVPEHIEIRRSPDNSGSDTAVYAVLPRDEWAELDGLASNIISHFFQPLG